MSAKSGTVSKLYLVTFAVMMRNRPESELVCHVTQHIYILDQYQPQYNSCILLMTTTLPTLLQQPRAKDTAFGGGAGHRQVLDKYMYSFQARHTAKSKS